MVGVREPLLTTPRSFALHSTASASGWAKRKQRLQFMEEAGTVIPLVRDLEARPAVRLSCDFHSAESTDLALTG
jgi:hypothetical protein